MLLGSLFLLLLAASIASPALAAGPPHGVVILVDDLGYGDPGAAVEAAGARWNLNSPQSAPVSGGGF